MGIAVEKLGIFDDLQSKGIKYLPKPRLVSGDRIVKHRSTLEEMACAAVDVAIAEAVAREIHARRNEIEEIAAARCPVGPSIEGVLSTICEVTGLTRETLGGSRASTEIACARKLFWYITGSLRRDQPLAALGHALGGKGHSTVYRAIASFHAARSSAPLVVWCAHPSIARLLMAADQHPRVT